MINYKDGVFIATRYLDHMNDECINYINRNTLEIIKLKKSNSFFNTKNRKLLKEKLLERKLIYLSLLKVSTKPSKKMKSLNYISNDKYISFYSKKNNINILDIPSIYYLVMDNSPLANRFKKSSVTNAYNEAKRGIINANTWVEDRKEKSDLISISNDLVKIFASINNFTDLNNILKKLETLSLKDKYYRMLLDKFNYISDNNHLFAMRDAINDVEEKDSIRKLSSRVFSVSDDAIDLIEDSEIRI